MLFNSISTTSTGIQAASNSIDSISNNIANSNTPGYKAGEITFQDLLYSSIRYGGEGGADATLPNLSQLGHGVGTGSVRGVFTQGSVTQSSGAFDLAINGRGFFRVTQRDGSVAYTRAGNFSRDENGRLVSSNGLLLTDNIVVPAGTARLSVGEDGTVTATDSGGVSQPVGRLTLTGFQNVNGLDRVGDNLFVATVGSGTGVTDAPGSNGLGTVATGSLEQSNVDLSAALTSLIVAQRSFSFNTRALETANTMVGSLLDAVG